MKKTSIALLGLTLSTASSFGAAGIFDGLVWTSTNPVFSFTDPGTSAFEIDNNTANLFGFAEFDGANLGVFNVGDTLFLTGEQKSFKNNNSFGGDPTDVTGHFLSYTVSGGSTINLTYGFEANLANPGDQRWGAANAGTTTGNLLDGLAPGDYTLTLTSSITTDGADGAPAIITNGGPGGNGYVATFSVVPEPSSSLLVGLGLVGLAARRRRA